MHLLRQAARAATLEIAHDISHAVLDPALGSTKVIDLAHGKAGRAVFLAQLAKATGDRIFATRSTELLDEALDAVAAIELLPSLLFGFTGIAWAYQHLGDAPEVLDEIDEVLLEHVSIDPWRGRFDFTLGLAGYGVYLLSRPRSLVVDRALAQIEQHLIANAVSVFDRTWWPPPEVAADRFDMFNDQAGIAGFLASAWTRLGVRGRALLPGALRWISHDLDDPAGCSRATWCYPSVVLTFLRAARRLDDPTWHERGLAIARRLARPSPKDASFMYGAAGVAHMLQRVYRATSDTDIGLAARDAYERLLSQRQPGAGFGGYRVLAPGNREWVSYPGITMGAAGIGLVLIGAWSDGEPTWDSVFQFELS